jgi:hypothetical protein
MFRRGTVSTLRALAATAALVLAAEHGDAQRSSLPVESIDVYGSTALDSAVIRAEFEPDILRYVETMDRAGSPNANFDELARTIFGIRDKLRATLEQRVPLAYLEISVLTNSAPPPPHINVTIDVVEKGDEARRMPFRAAPTRELPDPGGLLAAVNELTAKYFDLLRSGGRDLRVTASECPVLHCLAPFTLPEFAPYLERFNTGAREHEEALYAVATESRLESHRANALLVLAHANDANRLLPLLSEAIYDPSAAVRNNAMRVLLFMAQRDPSRDYPLDALLAAFDFPAASDRNKAGGVLVALAKSPRYRDRIRATSVTVALHQLRLEQPVNHDLAYELLKVLSGEELGERDYSAWERWAAGSTSAL